MDGETIMENYTTISISMDGVWSGSGKIRDGEIVDCSAQFCDDTDESLKVYEMIEEAIDDGRDSLVVELDGERREMTWTITEPM